EGAGDEGTQCGGRHARRLGSRGGHLGRFLARRRGELAGICVASGIGRRQVACPARLNVWRACNIYPAPSLDFPCLKLSDPMSTDTDTTAQTHPFQAEVAELLRLMVHSVYSETEIFLRELISNASDACDRLRYEAIAKPDLLVENPRLAIRITPDAA